MAGSKLYAERLKKSEEEESEWIMPKSFRLRFSLDDFVLFKPPFRGILESTGAPYAPIDPANAIEGIFTLTDSANESVFEGIFNTDEEVQADALEIEEFEVSVDELLTDVQATQSEQRIGQIDQALDTDLSGVALITKDDQNKDDQPLETYTYTVSGPLIITTAKQRETWQKMTAQQIVADLGYDWNKVHKEFADANPAAGSSLNAWIKKTIIDYGWREGQVPPDILQTTVDYATDGTPIIEAFRAKDAFDIAVNQLSIKEFQSFYWKGKVFGKIERRTIIYGSAEVAYNKLHTDQGDRLQLIEDLYVASGDIVLCNNALAEKNTGDAFEKLVRSAQEVLFYDQPGQVDGKLGPLTMAALTNWTNRANGYGFDPYIERLARRYAILAIPNKAAQDKYEREQSDQRALDILTIQSTGETGEMGRTIKGQLDLNARYKYGITQSEPDKPYKEPEILVKQLISQYPRNSKDPAGFNPSNNILRIDDNILVRMAYDSLQQEGQESVNAPILSNQPASGYEYKLHRLNEDLQILLTLLSRNSKGGVATATFDQTETQAKSLLDATEFEFFKFWRTTTDKFLNQNIVSTSRPSKQSGASLDTNIYIDDEATAFEDDLNKLMGWYDIGYIPKVYTNEQAVDILMQGGDILNRDIIAALKLPETDPFIGLVTRFQKSSERYQAFTSLDRSVTGTLIPVQATFETTESAAKKAEYNPATGTAAPTAFPLDMILEKKGDNDYVLHLMSGGGSEHPQTSGDSLSECMSKLADGKVLPQGTIYYYNPEDKSPADQKVLHKQVITNATTWSDVLMEASIVLAVLAAIPSGGSSLLIIGAGIAGAVSIGLQMYERNEVGELNGTDALLDVSNIVGCLLPIVGELAAAGVFARYSTAVRTGEATIQETKAIFLSQFKPVSITTNIGVITANGISLSQGIIDSLAAIDKQIDPKDPDAETKRAALRQQIITEGIFMGTFMIACIGLEIRSAMPGKISGAYKVGQEVVDEEGAMFRISKGTNEGEYYRDYIQTGKKVPMNAEDAYFPGKTIKPGASGITSARPSEIITDQEGNYYRHYTDTGETVPISKAQFEAVGGVVGSPTQYEVYTEGGKYRKRIAGSTEQGVEISGEEYLSAKVKSIVQGTLGKAQEEALTKRNLASEDFKQTLIKALGAYAVGQLLYSADPDAKGGPSILMAGGLFFAFKLKGSELTRDILAQDMKITDEELIQQVKNELRSVKELQPHFENFKQNKGEGDALDHIKLENENGAKISLEDFIKNERQNYENGIIGDFRTKYPDSRITDEQIIYANKNKLITAKRTDPNIGNINKLDFNIIEGKLSFKTKQSLPRFFDFVIMENGELRIGGGHYYLSDGAAYVKGAGQIYVESNGQISIVNNNSGHYLTNDQELIEQFLILRKMNIFREDCVPHNVFK